MSDPRLHAGDDPAYREALLAKLAGADPIDQLSALFERLPAALQGLDEAELSTPEAPGKWSILQVVRHLADVELVQGMRIRRILSEKRPTLVPMDQDVWMERLWTTDSHLEDALDMLRALRLANLRLVTHLPADALARESLHPERGIETLQTLLCVVAAHDIVHLEQIARIRGAIAPAAGSASDAGSASGAESE